MIDPTGPAGSRFLGAERAQRLAPPQEIIAHSLGRLGELSYGGFPIPAEPILIPGASYRTLLSATARLLKLHCETVRQLGSTSLDRLGTLGLDPLDYPRFTDDPDFEDSHASDVARADVVIGSDGPQFIELNVGAGINGLVQFELQRRMWEALLAQAGHAVTEGENPFTALASLIGRTMREAGRTEPAYLVGSVSDPGLTSHHFRVEEKLLAETGVRAEFLPLEYVAQRRSSTNSWPRSLGLIQFHEREARDNGWDLHPLIVAMTHGFMGIPSQTCRLADSKKVMALLSEGLPWMSEGDTDFVATYVPWTRIVRPSSVYWRGQTCDLSRLLIKEQASFVLKGSAGLSAQEVHFGAGVDPHRWQQLVADALISEYYVAQEIVHPVRRPVDVIVDPTGRIESIDANSVISPFSVDGVPSGCLFRFSGQESGKASISRSAGATLGCLLSSSN